VSKPVLYQHFPGKLELYLALLDESVQRSPQRSGPRWVHDGQQAAGHRHVHCFLRLRSEHGQHSAGVRVRPAATSLPCAPGWMIRPGLRGNDQRDLLRTPASATRRRTCGHRLVGMAQVSANTGWAPTGDPKDARSSSWPGWPGAGSGLAAGPATLLLRTSERITVEVKIGIQSIQRELVLDTPSPD